MFVVVITGVIFANGATVVAVVMLVDMATVVGKHRSCIQWW